MNKKINFSLFRHFLYVFGSQIIVLISGIIKTLVIPALFSLPDFGYWQIYIFYTVYIGIFTLGYGDGLYLKYGGFKFDNLPMGKIRTANMLYLLMLAFGSISLAGYAFLNADAYRQLIFFAIAANVAMLGVTSTISLILQATNMLKGYAFINSADKIFFTFALLALFQNVFRTVEYLIIIDIVAKSIVLAMLCYRYHQLYFGPLNSFYEGLREFLDSIRSGFMLLLANLSSMLVLGVGRIIIEYFGKIESYAYYSFAVSLSNIVVMSVTALSIVIYPALSSQAPEDYPGYFNKTNQAYSLFVLSMLSGYFPAVAFVKLIATQYSPVLDFLNAIFVITVLQGKMQLVNNTFYKTLRLERPMLVANALSLLIASVLSFVVFSVFQSIMVIAYVAIVTMLFQVYASEFYLRNYMKEGFTLRPLAEIVLLAVFLLVTWALPPIHALGVWFSIVIVLVIFNHSKLLTAWHQFQERTQ